jgi:hypothetical protein
MFELKPSPEFSTWFETLCPAAAEEVACALDLLAASGTALGPSHARRALLWFDDTGDAAPGDFDHSCAFMWRYLAGQLGDDIQELLLWQREIVRCLESEPFRQRLARLSPEAARLSLTAIERLKRRLTATRRGIVLEAHAIFPQRLAQWTAGLAWREQRTVAEQFGFGQSPQSSQSRSLKELFFEVLHLVGLDHAQAMNGHSGLCELTVRGKGPHLRVLFGLDAPAQRIVLLLGEPLTRTYYGDSVTFAERCWRQYCQSGPQPLEVAEKPR